MKLKIVLTAYDDSDVVIEQTRDIKEFSSVGHLASQTDVCADALKLLVQVLAVRAKNTAEPK